MEPRIQLLLVDDQAAIRCGLRMWLALEPDLEVVGEASSGAQAILAASALRPDVVLLSAELPGTDVGTATTAIHDACPRAAIVVLSLHEDAPTRDRVLAAGAAAFVARGTGEAHLLTAIRRFSRAV